MPLLTREGEVALAKRIEDAESAIVPALVSSPAPVSDLSRIAEELHAGALRARDITRNPADEEDEAAARQRLLELFASVRLLDGACGVCVISKSCVQRRRTRSSKCDPRAPC